MNNFVDFQWKGKTKLIKGVSWENKNLNSQEPGKGLRDFYKKLLLKGSDWKNGKING